MKNIKQHMITDENFDEKLCTKRQSKKNPLYYNIDDLHTYLIKKNLPIYGNKKKLCIRIKNYLNNRLFVIECGMGGDCLFHSIAYLLSKFNNINYDYKNIRELTANLINKNNINSILDTYTVDYINNKSDFLWNPSKLIKFESETKKIETFKCIIKTSGFLYEGDLISLNLITNSDIFIQNKIGLIIITNTRQIIRIETSKYEPDIFGILFNISNIHWQLIGGYINNNKKYFFTKNDLDYFNLKYD